MQIRVRTAGLDKLKKVLDRKQEQLRDMSPFWRTVGDTIVAWTIRRRFEKEQDPQGRSWKPWSRGYAEYKRRRGRSGDNILTDTHELRASLNRTNSVIALRDRVIVGTNKEYAAIHQFGGKITTKREGEYKRNYGPDKQKGDHYAYSWTITIPARPFLGVNDMEIEEIKRHMTLYLTNER